MSELPVLKSGCLAWYESLQGWLQCKVVTMPDRDHVTVMLTAYCSPIARGIEFKTTILHVVPRKSLHTVRGSYGRKRYISRFTVECDNA